MYHGSFAELFKREQTDCGKVLETLTAAGVSYSVLEAEELGLTVGGVGIELDPTWLGEGSLRTVALRSALTDFGFDFSKQRPAAVNLLGIIIILLGLGMLSALTYGSVAALLSEMFPPSIRYSSM